MEGIATATSSFAGVGDTVAEAERVQSTELDRILLLAFRFAYAWLRAPVREDAEEIAQEVAWAAHKKFRRRLGDCGNAWVWTTTRNMTENWKRGATRSQRRDTEWHALQDGDKQVPEQMKRLRRREVREAIAKLSRKQRQVVVLFYLGENTIEEVSKLLGIRPGTAKSRLNKARKLLKETLG